ncbi:MAG TPA: hypothetical protein VLO11_04665 [Luteolibacter sp.]|nr:hypothetical protein [Luteolibacter sp.]
MTDKEKLQALFDAAMRSPEEPGGKLKRAVPGAAAIKPSAEEPASVKTEEKPAANSPAEALDKEAAGALGLLLDERIRRDKRKRRVEVLVTTVVLLGSALCGTVWFVQDKERVSAMTQAVDEIRTTGDPEAMAANYNQALGKIAQRGNQLDDATAGMGVNSTQNHGGDVHMEAEMRQMMGGQGGATTGQRNKLLAQSFGGMDGIE